MKFEKFYPDEPVNRSVAYYWTLCKERDETGRKYRFVPDGYVDWIFHLRLPWKYCFPERASAFQTPSHVLGQFGKYLDLEIPFGDFRLFGVKFFPWAAQSIWKVDMKSTTAQYISLPELPDPALKDLPERIMTAPDTMARVKIIHDYIKNRMTCSGSYHLKNEIRQLTRGFPRLSDCRFPFSSRRLEQRFNSEIGLSPKRFQRIIKINRVIDRLIKRQDRKLTDIAYLFNYADQAHFINDFRQFTGYSPSVFLRNINPHGDIFNLRTD